MQDEHEPGFAAGVVIALAAVAFMILMIGSWLRDKAPSWWW